MEFKQKRRNSRNKKYHTQLMVLFIREKNDSPIWLTDADLLSRKTLFHNHKGMLLSLSK